MEAFISYDGLPVNSGGAHSLNRKSVKDNYEQIIYFLTLFSDTQKPIKITLEYAPKENVIKTVRFWLRLTSLFGIPNWKFQSLGSFWIWGVTIDRQEEALLLLNSSNNLVSTLTLTFLWHFHFLDPDTGETLVGQDEIPVLDERINNSRIYLRLGQQSTVSAWFAFPFPNLTAENRNYLGHICRSLPFKPSNKHWRLWKKTKGGNWIPNIIKLT